MRNDKLIQIRVCHDEKNAWLEAAKEEGMGLSEWIRGLCNLECQFAGSNPAPVAGAGEPVGKPVGGSRPSSSFKALNTVKLAAKWVEEDKERRLLEGRDYSDMPRAAQVSAPERGIDPPGRPVAHPESGTAPSPRKTIRTCVHGTSKGYNCWQCGGVARMGVED